MIEWSLFLVALMPDRTLAFYPDEAAYAPHKVLHDAFRSIGPALAQQYFNGMLHKLQECCCVSDESTASTR